MVLLILKFGKDDAILDLRMRHTHTQPSAQKSALDFHCLLFIAFIDQQTNGTECCADTLTSPGIVRQKSRLGSACTPANPFVFML